MLKALAMLLSVSSSHWISKPTSRETVTHDSVRPNAADAQASFAILANDDIICRKLLEWLLGLF